MSAWTNKYIQKNKYSRPAIKLHGVKKLVIHWTANYGATAANHFNYFNSLNGRYASAHIFVDKNEALCIVPLDEVAYHCNDGVHRGVPELRPNGNFLSIGVEMCVEKDGTFHPDTIKRTEVVMAELCKMYNLDPVDDIVRHYDITLKSCPTPWVRDKQQFINFKNNVKAKLDVKPAPPKQDKLMWGKVELKPNQIGKITVLKPINLWKRDDNNNLHFVRILKEGEEYRVYGYDELHGGQYDVGARHYVTKMPTHILYQTPSKALLAKAAELYK